MLVEGLGLMAVGMSTVFAFLGILVVSIHVLSLVAARFPPPQSAIPRAGMATATGTENDAEIAVVLAAIAAFRQKQGREA